MESTAGTEGELFIEVNGIKVCYTDSVNGDIPVVFIHGFPFDKSMWEPQVEFLKKDFRVITYDIRGFGKSGSGAQPTDIDLFAKDFVEFMDVLDIKEAVVCGHSLGGYILMTAANRNFEKLRGLILCDTQCIAESEETKQGMIELAADLEKDGHNKFIDTIINNAFSEATRRSNTQVIDKAKQSAHVTSPKTLKLSLIALSQRHEICNQLKELTVPVMVICGKEDNIIPLSRSEFIFNSVENAQLKVIENAGYLPNLEQPQIFNGHMISFLQGLRWIFVKN
jgi:3-oxoadipate enol-lactonase